MDVQCGLVLPSFEESQLVGIYDALKDFELFAAGLFRYFGAADFV
jgi:hypothetical protein